MTAPAAPLQLLSQRLPAPPEAVWARVQHSGFIASCLGAQLPAATLAPGDQLAGLDRDGAPLRLSVIEMQAPNALLLRLAGAGPARRLRLLIVAQGPGSRLTLLHEADDAAAPAPGLGGPGLDAPATPLARRLAAPLPTLLQAGPADSEAVLAAARRYLADSAALVHELRGLMAPTQGYAQPAAGGFSLVQHLWHLADVEQFGWAQRFQRLRLEDKPLLPGVDGDRLAIEGRYQQRPWRAAARRFVAQRQHTLAALARCDAQVLRRPVHFSGQACDGAQMLAALLAHDHEHRNEMAALWPPSEDAA